MWRFQFLLAGIILLLFFIYLIFLQPSMSEKKGKEERGNQNI